MQDMQGMQGMQRQGGINSRVFCCTERLGNWVESQAGRSAGDWTPVSAVEGAFPEAPEG